MNYTQMVKAENDLIITMHYRYNNLIKTKLWVLLEGVGTTLAFVGL